MQKVFQAADILLPREGTDQSKWSVVACDQFTSEPEYWEAVEEIVGDAPSTYRMILPEVYLQAPDQDSRIQKINQAMETYLKENVFTEYKEAMIYVQRTDSTGKVREGLVGAIDLEEYNYEKGSTSLVRATEATVIERIPPRIKVRENAPIELPHIMILIDDEDKAVIEPLASKTSHLSKVYDFDLIQDGGHLTGYLLKKEDQTPIYDALNDLGKPSIFEEKYGLKDTSVLLYAMGDGNHSLATAKAYYERLKKENPDKDLSGHPARYALVELVNLHSPALEFEAIHRILTEINENDLIDAMTKELGLTVSQIPYTDCDQQSFLVICNGADTNYVISNPTSKLTVGSVQTFLDSYLKKNGGEIDYIHGIDVVRNLAKAPHSLGIVLPDMGKDELFPTVIVDGALPRKTFSMGHAQDKRYYMECRKIR